MKHCLKCNMVWEYKSKMEIRISRYKDFPTYGKPKKTCPKCLGIKEIRRKRKQTA